MNQEGLESGSTEMGEVSLVLAEKRTALALLRTGIAVLALPMSVISFLIATSRHYDIVHVLRLLIPLGLLNLALVAFGVYLVVVSIIKMREYDRIITNLKKRHNLVSTLVE
jgi:uncharacterized membrane protein YidH (DUF202 family)